MFEIFSMMRLEYVHLDHYSVCIYCMCVVSIDVIVQFRYQGIPELEPRQISELHLPEFFEYFRYDGPRPVNRYETL